MPVAGLEAVTCPQVRQTCRGAEVEINYWVVITFRQGRIVRDQWFGDRAEALEAAGLQE
jgi:ketosteroid isomerase-like protein